MSPPAVTELDLQDLEALLDTLRSEQRAAYADHLRLERSIVWTWLTVAALVVRELWQAL